MDECQAAANALATEWINNGNYLANLTEDNKDYYITQLNNMGIENAAAIVTDTLSAKKIAEKYAINDLTDATVAEISVKYDEIAALIKEGEVSDATAGALYNLIAQQTIFSNQGLDVYGKIAALQKLGEAFGITADAATTAAQAMNVNSIVNQLQAAGHPEAIQGALDGYLNNMSSAFQEKISAKYGQINVNPSGSGNYSGGGSTRRNSGGGTDKAKDTKQTIDWIDKKIQSLNNHIDLTQSKLDLLFNTKSPKNLSKKIADVSKKLKSANSNTEKWKNSLSKIKIPDSAKKLIQSGKDIDLSKYSKSEQKNIKKYQTNWNKYSAWSKRASALEDRKSNLETQKGKEGYLRLQEKDYNALAKVLDEIFDEIKKVIK